MKTKKIIAWTLFLFWLILIFLFSNQSGHASSNLSNGIVTKCLQIFSIPIDSNILGFLVRKTAHFIEYLILAILYLNVLTKYQPLNARNISILFLFCFFYAASDEIHQIFSINRGPSFFDVLLDYCGSLFGVVSYVLIRNNTKK